MRSNYYFMWSLHGGVHTAEGEGVAVSKHVGLIWFIAHWIECTDTIEETLFRAFDLYRLPTLRFHIGNRIDAFLLHNLIMNPLLNCLYFWREWHNLFEYIMLHDSLFCLLCHYLKYFGANVYLKKTIFPLSIYVFEDWVTPNHAKLRY